MRNSPPPPPRTDERLAEELRRTVSGEVSWSLGSSNARLILSTLGYGLNMNNAKMAEVMVGQVLVQMGYAPGTDLAKLPEKEKNQVAKFVDKELRKADRRDFEKFTKETSGGDKFASDFLGNRGQVRSLDRFHDEWLTELGTDSLLVNPVFTDSTSLGKSPIESHGPRDLDYGKAMGSAVGKLDQIHRDNRTSGKVRPEYERDVQIVADALCEGGFRMEKPQGSSIHHLIQFMRESPKGAVNPDFLQMLEHNFQSFVVEHDWASAFSKSEDFDGGEVNLPFDYTCFEFRVNGLRVLVPLGKDATGKTIGCLVSGVNRNWYINQSSLVFTSDGQLQDIDIEKAKQDGTMPKGVGVIDGFIQALGRQIRAVCIMLDAKVARGDVVQPSEALNKSRRKQGKFELKPYHVVSLARRQRTEHERGDGTGTHKRLHWRRGHWRHYQQPTGKIQYHDDQAVLRSKTWIHWQLIGDPDLGFVNKHYRL